MVMIQHDFELETCLCQGYLFFGLFGLRTKIQLFFNFEKVGYLLFFKKYKYENFLV
uniref:Uncharacterized protein n=1 Tax=Arundo donax TaxID=35708 RepID=A0A0A9CDV5_ARUDO